MKITSTTVKIARILFGLSIFVLGFQHIYYKQLNPALFPLSPRFTGFMFLAYTSGVIMMLCGIAIMINKWRYPAFLITGLLFLLSFLAIHFPILMANLKNAIEWTIAFETLAIMSGAMLFTVYNGNRTWKIIQTNDHGVNISKMFFAVSMLVFGIQHFQYADFVATLIPFWIPFHLFWAYFVGVCFIASAISLFLNIRVRLAMVLLGSMFLIWVIILHAPRVYNHILDFAEWSSMMIALLMACISFFIMSFYEPLIPKNHEL